MNEESKLFWEETSPENVSEIVQYLKDHDLKYLSGMIEDIKENGKDPTSYIKSLKEDISMGFGSVEDFLRQRNEEIKVFASSKIDLGQDVLDSLSSWDLNKVSQPVGVDSDLDAGTLKNRNERNKRNTERLGKTENKGEEIKILNLTSYEVAFNIDDYIKQATKEINSPQQSNPFYSSREEEVSL